MKNNNFKIMYIPKSKGYRKIITYKDNDVEIRRYHIDISKFIYNNTLPSKFSKAYIKKRSIITNAKAHMYNDVFLYFDIKDFFQNINHNKLIDLLYHEINKGSKIKTSKIDCNNIVKSCAVSGKGLGVGLIPSPLLSNMYLKEFDNILYGKLKKMDLPNVIYTRYADDMVISFKYIESYDMSEVKNLIGILLRRYGLKLNDKKVKIINLNKSNHVRITGINLCKDENNNRRLTVGRKRKNELYYKAIETISKPAKDREDIQIKKIKGLQSFVLSIEGEMYENTYSQNMISIINNYGFKNLKSLIDNL
ncbi:reverse transcriptase domain-containing protein [Clostridioides difficile]|uniref:reverse transcriptase domain-containing protein n=1 Tax=Clostridioides difficile TaxID=1496 RepID=UPI002FD24B0D|nr:RNA-directed DNA polymerase [Clostridioides difficile]